MNEKRAKADAEYRSLIQNELAIEVVRGKERGTGGTRRIALTCSGHKTGIAIVLAVSSEEGEGETVADYLVMYPMVDTTAEKPGEVTTGQSYSIRCGDCGRATRRQDIKLLQAAIKCVITAGREPTNGWRISIT